MSEQQDAIELVGAFQKACIELGQSMSDDNHQIMIECRLALIAVLSVAQPAAPVVSDEQIDPLVQKHARATWSGSQQNWDVAEFSRLGLVMFANAILALRPAVEPMTDEVRRSYQCLLAMNTPHGFGDRIGPFVKWLQDSGITAKAEDTHQPTKEAE